MLLAIVTGQRLGDISRMKFSDIWDDHLHVEQEKTGSKLAIPCRFDAMLLTGVCGMSWPDAEITLSVPI